MDVVNVPLPYVALMFNVIGVVSSRGAFKPEEFKPVGELFEYLQKELKTREDAKKETEDAEQPPPASS